MRKFWLSALAIACTGCDPFDAAATKFEGKLSADEAASLEMLAPDRKLPREARNVWLDFIQFQDPFMRVRFLAPKDVALKFAVDQTGVELEPGCGLFLMDDRLDWWLDECPEAALHTEMRRSDNPPARAYVVVPDGEMATVWLVTSSD